MTKPKGPYISVDGKFQIVESYYLGKRNIPVSNGKTLSLYVFKHKDTHHLFGVWHCAGFEGLLRKHIGHLSRLTLKEFSPKVRLKVEIDEDVSISFDEEEINIFASTASLVHAPAFIEIPNGSALKFAKHYDKGGCAGAFRSRKSQLDPQDFKSTEKKELPRLYLWSSKTQQHAIAADFDSLPPGCDSFDELHQTLIDDLMTPQKAVVIRTPSDNVKAIFVIDLPEGVSMNYNIALGALKAVLPSEYLDWVGAIGRNRKMIIDTKAAALHTVFLTSDNASAISLHLRHIKAMLYTPPDVLLVQPSSETVEHKFRTYDGQLSPNFQVAVKRSKPKETFLRILLASEKLIAKEGFQIPMPYLGKHTGVKWQSVQKWVKQFIKKKWLVVTDKSYSFNKGTAFAKTYVAGGDLASEIKRINGNFKTQLKNALPTSIADGDWDKELHKSAGFFAGKNNSLSEYLGWVKTIHGWNKKTERIKEAEHHFEAFRKYLLKRKSFKP